MTTKAERLAAAKTRLYGALAVYTATFEKFPAEYPTPTARAQAILDCDVACRSLASFGRTDSPIEKLTPCQAEKINEAAAWLVTNEAAVKEASAHVAIRITLPAKLRNRIETSKAALVAFAAKVSGDHPLMVLEGSGSAFVTAARLRVAEELLGFLVSDRATRKTDAEMTTLTINHLRDETLRRARDINRSTSSVANLAEDCLRSAYAEMYEALVSLGDGFIGWGF